ncbi:Uncharacterized protein GBIM_19614 [Gryllus bimaculatus]|nr:Uncharacterized protein GBIM_19614 [Gryllus bimaculatus]
MSASDVVAEEYASSLSDLVANSKPLINMLTMLAEENIDHAPAIVQAVERHLQQVRSDIKLPVLYLIDSIVKNVRQAYTGLFTQNIVSTFCSVFEKVDEKTRAQMFKLRQTWNDVFPTKKLYAMDVRVSSIDPAWPITAPVPTSIHINPKFFPKQGNSPAPIVSPLQSSASSALLTAPATSVNVPEDPQAFAESKMREQLLKKQKKLLELQQKKLEIELLQTKAKLEEQQKQLERQTDHLHVQQLLLPALQNAGQDAASKQFGPLLDIASSSSGVKSEHATQSTATSQVSGAPQVVAASTPSTVATSSGPSRSPSKMTEVSTSKAKTAGKAAAGPGGNSSRSRDPRLATRQPVPTQPNVVTNVTSENLQQPTSQLAPIQDNTNSVFETVKLETAKPKPLITINIANKGNANKEPQGVSKKDPRLNSNKVHVSHSKIRSESKNSGPSKGPNKSTRGPSPLPAPQSPSRCGKPAPLPRKVHGKGSSSSTNKSSHKSASVIDLTDSPPHKTEKKEEELAGKDKDSHSEPLSKSSSSSSSSGSNSSSSPGSKKDSHKSKMSSTSNRQSPSEKKKGSEKGGKVSEIGSGSNLSNRRAKSPGGSIRLSRERERDRSASKNFDMFEPEADSPSPPPPPVISDNQKREDTTFKDRKVSKKGRNYVRRNRRDESRSPEVSTVTSGDVDLRLGAPPEKHPRMGAFPADGTPSSTEDDGKKTLVDATTKDVDLRQLSRSPTKKRPSMERSDQPPNKKSKAEMIDVLFGNEDVDLRQLAPISVVTQQGMPPSPPPPPIISQPSPTQSASNQDSSVASNSPKIKSELDKDVPSETKSDIDDSHRVKENGEGKSFRGWEKYKESKPDIYKSPFRSHKLEPSHKTASPARDSVYNSRDRNVGVFNRHIGDRMEYDGLGRPLLYHRFHDMVVDRRQRHGQNAMSSPIGEDTDMRTHLLDPDTLEDVDMNISIIIHQADEQLKNGGMSFPEYNTLLKQVIRLNEMQKLREAKRRDQQENKESWERNRRRVGELGKASPRSEDENSRGAPTRELYVDGKWYECFFGGPPVSIEMGGKIRLVKLEGPPPQVKIGMIKRTDLVAGKINLIINARNMVPIFLDAKPQRFDIEGKAHILRFTHALTNVQINGRSFKVEFGGLPKPIVVNGKKHFIRFSVLPRGIQPGYINIVNMEGERLPSPAHADGDGQDTTFSPPDENDEAKLRKVNEPALPMLDQFLNNLVDTEGRARQRRFGTGQDSPSDSEPARSSPATVQSDSSAQKLGQSVTSQLPLEMLTSLMPVAMAPSSGYSYQVEQESQDTQQRSSSEASTIPVSTTTAAAAATTATASSTSTAKGGQDGTMPLAAVVAPNTSPVVIAAGIPFLLPEINVDELFQKLVATGIVAPSVAAEESKKKKDDDADTVKFVDFSQPETLKVRQPALIAALYSGIQCSSCGVRFAPEQTMKYSQHLDWHFRQNRRDRDNTRKAQSRKWYYDISDWIQFEEIEDLEERAQSWFETQQAAEGRSEEKESIEVPSVPAGDSAEDTACDVCHDKFEQFYNEETEEWHLRLAVRVEGKTYHPLCYEDLKANLERSLDESVTTDEVKQEETEKEGEKTAEKPIENDSENKKNDAEEIDDAKELDSSVPADSTDQEMEELSDAVKQEMLIKDEVTSQEEIENPSSVTDTELMQVAECDSTVVKSEDNDVDTPIEEETATTVPVVPKVDTTHTEVACSIDGNVKFEDKPQTAIAGPISGKIKINITKPLPVLIREAQSEGDAESSAAEGDADDTDEAPQPQPPPPQNEGSAADVKDMVKEPTLEQEFPEPPPPGIEPVRLKPRLVGRKLTEMPPVMKGTELSGLCSIM